MIEKYEGVEFRLSKAIFTKVSYLSKVSFQVRK